MEANFSTHVLRVLKVVVYQVFWTILRVSAMRLAGVER